MLSSACGFMYFDTFFVIDPYTSSVTVANEDTISQRRVLLLW